MKKIDKLAKVIASRVHLILATDAGDPNGLLYELQPPDTIMKLAAEAAANVFVAFERGYRMDMDSEA